MSQSKFKHESTLLAKLSGPIIIGQVGQNLIILTDTLMVGALGTLPLSASAFAGSVFFVALVAGMGVLAPTTALFARAQGQGNFPQGGLLLRHSLLVTFLTSAILVAVLYLILHNLKIFGQTAQVVAAAYSFFEIITWSLVPSLIYQCYKQFGDGIGRTKVSMYAMLAGVIFNFVANYMLIFGNWGAPRLGLDGAAYGTLISRSLMAILMVLYVHFHPHFKAYLEGAWRHNLDHFMLKSMFRLGLPNGLTFLFEVGAFSFAAIMMGWFGAMPLAAHQITISLASMTFLISVGLGIASSIRVGYEVGRGNYEMARYSGFTSLKIGTVYSAVCALGFLLLRDWLPTLYVKDIDVIELASLLFIVVGFFQIFDGLQAVVVGALRGMSDTAWPSAIAFVSYWIVGLPGGYLMAFHLGFGPVGVWGGLLLALISASTLLTWRFHILSKRFLVPRIETSHV